MFWSALGSVLWAVIVFPVIWILEHLVALLVIVLAPLLHVLQYALHAALIPFRFLAKFEAVYVYLGTAILLGLFTGIVLYVVSYLLSPLLGIKPNSDEPGPTAASYRAQRAERKARSAKQLTSLGVSASPLSGQVFQRDDSDWAAVQNHGPPTPMMGTMILEEGSSSE